MKRKADAQAGGKAPVKKRSKAALSDDDAKKRFRDGLFDQKVLDKYTSQYASSSPYKHSVIDGLVNDQLLRSVRDEIRNNVSFTPKETDIYKIHQSGDLANLDGLDDEALSKLPSLLALRDALYSETFRDYVSHITGCGSLSGRKTDMAINVYTPGSYLLCHDDVIGSRKVSYILYLTDPDTPWQSEWGGALRLFPVEERPGKDGQVAKVPLPDVVKIIPPAWNQLSFFAVQPGESFHDVEEVYHAPSPAELEKNGGRVRMAISGWFHIPQIGEDGYVKGAEEAQAKNSSLMQLQGNPDQHDLPASKATPIESGKDSQDSQSFDEEDLEFLLKYIAPTYLTPDTIAGMAEHFDENSSITIPDILNKKFAARLHDYVTKQEAANLPVDSAAIEKQIAWTVARPPHKHRYLYLQSGTAAAKGSPIKELLDVLLPSKPFRAWLELTTNSAVTSHNVIARRFRRGQDYTLATGHEGQPRLELNLGLTPTPGWGDAEDNDEEDEDEDEDIPATKNGKATASSKSKGKEQAKTSKSNGKTDDGPEEEPEEVGGHEVYMAGDDDGNEDAAIYKASGDEDNILFFQAAAWNKMTIVMRDSGTLKFVKYVSRKAKGDRWDVSATFEIEEQDDAGEDEDPNSQILESEEEEEFRGFSPSEDSDSD